MSFVRDILFGVIGVISAPFWLSRMAKTGKLKTDWPGRFGKTTVKPADRPTILIHAVSVGEVNAIRQLIDQLVEKLGDNVRLVISVTTDTGTARARQLYEPDHEVVRYPFDFTFAVKRFLNAIKPDVVALVELELWPTFMAQCVKRQIPVSVINGRLSERSYRRYHKFKFFVQKMFSQLAAVGVQDETYASRFEGVGVERSRITVTGTMKWDTAQIADDVSGADDLAKALGINPKLPLIVCGSTGPGEEQLMTEKLGNLKLADGRLVQLLITPRKPERFDEASTAMRQPIRRSEHLQDTRAIDDHHLFLLDTMGELRRAYALADVVIVGRSFSGQWGSDMMEPVALGKPTVIGPDTGDFQETMKQLLAGDGIIQLPDADQLAATVLELIDSDRGRQLASNGRAVIRKQQGATLRYVELIEKLLKGRVGHGNEQSE